MVMATRSSLKPTWNLFSEDILRAGKAKAKFHYRMARTVMVFIPKIRQLSRFCIRFITDLWKLDNSNQGSNGGVGEKGLCQLRIGIFEKCVALKISINSLYKVFLTFSPSFAKLCSKIFKFLKLNKFWLE